MRAAPRPSHIVVRDPSVLFAPPAVRVERRQDGSILLNAVQPLGSYPTALSEHLLYWARKAPDRAFILERDQTGVWMGATYGQALEKVLRLAGGLAALNLTAARPIAILSDNTVEHGLLMLAAMHIGIPVLSISSAYSLASRDFLKLKSIIRRTTPSLIYVDDAGHFAPALEAIRRLHQATIIVGERSAIPADALPLSELYRDDQAVAVAEAYASVTADTIAKILFTSGSTDEPKGVINTQRMLCASQQAKAQVWPFLYTHPPTLVDWLPWNHTFGGNHNFNLILRNGGTLYIDGGRPIPAAFHQTLANLRDISPTIYVNVPRGFELLVHALKADGALRSTFFSRLQLIFYAAASLPSHLWDALGELSIQATGEAIPLVSAWGATETAPLATDCHFSATHAGVIGLPVPGCELKLVPNGNKLEVRVRGANVFPGYWRQPEVTSQIFDEEGFYLIGDAVRFADESVPERGLIFDGRVSEDFKLTTGTWVSVGNLRLRAIAALAPIAQDVVVAGHDQSAVSFLIFPNVVECRAMLKTLQQDADVEEVLAHPDLRAHVANALLALKRAAPASSTHGVRAVLLSEPPSIDAGEITDKGYINQRAVLNRRKHIVASLFSPDHADVIGLPG
jgi:feruloyl-CoA synthase